MKTTGADRVRRLALALEGTIEKPSYGTPGFRVNDTLYARVLPEDDSVIVKVDPGLRSALVASAPGVFAVTPHYLDTPWVIVRLGAIDSRKLKGLLTESWTLTR